MSNCILHAFFIPQKNGYNVLSLTDKYKFTLEMDDGFPIFRLKESNPQTANNHETSSPVASLTVIYGINGGGKTKFLLDVCNSIGREQGARPLGVLWEYSGEIYFDSGRQLKHARVLGQDVIPHASLRQFKANTGAIFYTTSPFEAARRRSSLKGSEIVDVTPSFNAENPFSGVPLFLAAQALPPNLPFIEDLQVQPKLKVPSLHSLVQEVISLRRRKGTPYAALSPEIAEALRDLPSYLDDFHRDALAIEMHRAIIDGTEATSVLLSELSEAITKSNSIVSVRKFLEERARRLSYPSLTMCEAIHDAKKLGKLKLRTRGPFMQFVEDVGAWPEATVQGILQVEALGLLKWSFIKLSSGQVAMLMLFASLAKALREHSNRRIGCVVLAIDEGEMFMHPEWQRTFLSQLLNFLSFYKSQFYSIHLLVATHSLIVAGDAPPNRLFDVVSGKMHNGFAAPPEELLRTVYHVQDFSGELAEKLYAKISGYLRSGGTIEDAREVKLLVSQIASPRLRNYLNEEVSRRMEAIHA